MADVNIVNDDTVVLNVAPDETTVVAIDESVITVDIHDVVSTFSSGLDKYFIFTQNVPSTSWTVTHNLAKKPSVTVVDSAGTAVEGSVTYLDDNSLRVDFSYAFSGTVYLN